MICKILVVETEKPTSVMIDPVLANATIDRMFDRAEVVVFEG